MHLNILYTYSYRSYFFEQEYVYFITGNAILTKKIK